METLKASPAGANIYRGAVLRLATSFVDEGYLIEMYCICTRLLSQRGDVLRTEDHEGRKRQYPDHRTSHAEYVRVCSALYSPILCREDHE